MSEIELRLECLKLALGVDPQRAVERAAEYLDFLRALSDAGGSLPRGMSQTDQDAG